MTCCDKCGLEVQPSNDATLVDAVAHNAPAVALFAQSRHFLPIRDKDGTLICEGSPSRAQYIDGQPRDTRGYAYLLEFEEKYRRAVAEVARQFSENRGTL